MFPGCETADSLSTRKTAHRRRVRVGGNRMNEVSRGFRAGCKTRRQVLECEFTDEVGTQKKWNMPESRDGVWLRSIGFVGRHR